MRADTRLGSAHVPIIAEDVRRQNRGRKCDSTAKGHI